jgi:hypothetical protein
MPRAGAGRGDCNELWNKARHSRANGIKNDKKPARGTQFAPAAATPSSIRPLIRGSIMNAGPAGLPGRLAAPDARRVTCAFAAANHEKSGLPIESRFLDTLL